MQCQLQCVCCVFEVLSLSVAVDDSDSSVVGDVGRTENENSPNESLTE